MQIAKNDLERIWAEVPPDYYFNLNLGQRMWHDWKWSVIKYLISQGTVSPKNILEVGCSSGHLTALIAGLFPKAKITGIDVYVDAIAEAKRRYPKLNFQVADAQKLPFKNDTFDLVVTSETIEHVVDPSAMLSEIYRVMKKEGLALVEMDSGSLLFRFIWYFWTRFGNGRVWKNAHLHPFSSKELHQLILTNKFTIKEKVFSHLGMAVSFLLTK